MSLSKPQYSNPPDHPPFAPTYSHISRVPLSSTTTLISLAGQVGYDANSKVIPPNLPNQVTIALYNVDRCLAAAGATKEDIVQVRQYVVKLHDPFDPKRAAVYSKWIGDAKPPSTLIGVESLASKELLYEIEVMAVVHNEK